jgi:hypothetical protein
MPRNAGQLQTWVGPGDRGGIGVTDSSMLLPESEPDPLQAQRLAVPLLEARRVLRLPLLCMCLSFVCVSHLLGEDRHSKANGQLCDGNY